MLEREVAFYRSHKNELREKFTDKRVLIHHEEIIGVFDDDASALDEAVKMFKPGDFMIKWVRATDEDEVVRCLSRVYV